ncbi:hypothetical protein [Azotobacter beijerinckii]|nr:hypothetical protein [Azotobacter beijerinckii]
MEVTVSFISGVNEPKDMLLKLIREGNRIIFEEDPAELSDHFFNFSVTAHSLRDWCLKSQNIQSQKKQANEAWDKHSYLVVAKDIANSVKHFGIDRYTPSLAGSEESSTDFVEFLHGEDIPAKMERAHSEEEFRRSVSQPRPSVLITFSDGSSIDLTDYAFKVINYWVGYFDENNIPRDCAMMQNTSMQTAKSGIKSHKTKEAACKYITSRSTSLASLTRLAKATLLLAR